MYCTVLLWSMVVFSVFKKMMHRNIVLLCESYLRCFNTHCVCLCVCVCNNVLINSLIIAKFNFDLTQDFSLQYNIQNGYSM